MTYKFYKNIVLRTPKYPISQSLEEVIHSASFEELIFTTSPSLYSEHFTKEATNKKTLDAVHKFFLRSKYRSTPFGLLASISLVDWGSASHIVPGKPARYTQLDSYFIHSFVKALCQQKFVRQNSYFYANPSWYRTASSIRYIRYLSEKKHRRYIISSALTTDILVEVLFYCQLPRKYEDIIEFISQKDYDDTETQQFARSLIDHQLLVSTLEPPIIGIAPLKHITEVVDCLKTEETSSIIESLKEVSRRVLELDTHPINSPNAYQEVCESFKIGVSDVTKCKFHIVSSRKICESTVAKAWQHPLRQAITVLNALTPNLGNSQLNLFAERYKARYGKQVRPLLSVLDTESGIGYPVGVGQSLNPLLDNVSFRPKEEAHHSPWHPQQQYLWRQLQYAHFYRQHIVDLPYKDITGQFDPQWRDLPPSLSVMFRAVQDNKILLDSVGGDSGTSLIGRFAHANSSIEKLARRIATDEQRLNPSVIFADIAHLPNDSTGNVVTRPPFYDYQIPLIVKSTGSKSISLQDLWVIPFDNKVYLYSKEHHRIIIPRLSTAHRYTTSQLPIYRFLCDLQSQGLRNNLSFRWCSAESTFKFLPRAECGPVILAPATWHLEEDDFAQVIDNKEMLSERIARFKEQWRLPDQVVLADYDQELFVDFNQTWTVKTFLHTIQGRKHITLKEFFYPSDIVQDREGDVYANQMIATLLKKVPTYERLKLPKDIHPILERNFLPGSQWLYYKIYCGTQVADYLITQAVFPLVQILFAQDTISQWFFIRYQDPEPHLRLRFHLNKKSLVSTAMALVKEKLSTSHQTGIIWRIQLDTYQREIERYGVDSIVLAEAIFYHDSAAIVKLLLDCTATNFEDIRWLKAIKLIHDLLVCFNLSLLERKLFMEVLRNSFAFEFRQDKMQKSQVDKLYRTHRTIVASVLDETQRHLFTKEDWLVFGERISRIQPIANQLLKIRHRSLPEDSTDNLLGSFVHMTCNRIFADAQRKHELIVYDFLSRYYRSQVARST